MAELARLNESVQLKTFKVAGAKSGKLPQRIKVLGWGRNETNQGPVIVDETTAKVFSANQKLIGRERVALDYEHNTVPGSPEFERTREPRDIAANLTLTVVPGEGLFGEALTYTSTGEAKSENYEDLSLAPYLDKDNRVIGAHSVALTRAGSAYGINFSEVQKLSAAEIKTLSAAGAAATDNNQTTMKNLKDPITGEQLAILVGLKADCTPEQLSSRLIAMSALASVIVVQDGKISEIAGLGLTDGKIVMLSALDGRLKAVEGKVPAGAVDITPLTTRIEALEKKISDGEAAMLGTERGRLIALFAAEGKVPKNAAGKVYTAEELKALDVPTLKLLHANTPVTVPLNARQMTLSAGEGKQFVEKDSTGKIIRVDMAGIFNSEAAQSGQMRPATA